MANFDVVRGFIVSLDWRDHLSIDTSTIIELLYISKDDHAIKLEELFVGFERTPTLDSKKFLHTLLIIVDFVPKFGIPTPIILFKEPFHMVLSLVAAIFGLNNDYEIDEATMALLMMIVLVDKMPPLMFQCIELLSIHIHNHFITII